MFDHSLQSVRQYSIYLFRLLVLGLGILSAPAQALSDQELFLHARESYNAKNQTALASDVEQLNDEQYLLAPYADYWLMLLRLDQAQNAEVESFLSKYGNYPFAERMRGEWLKKLGKQQDWQAFFDQYVHYKRDDVAVQCYALLGRGIAEGVGTELTGQVRDVWMTATDQPATCNPLFDAMQQAGALSSEDLWARFRLALQHGKLSLAKNIAGRITDFDAKDLRLLDVANQTPKALLDGKSRTVKNGRKKTVVSMAASYKTRAGIEINLYALDRLARSGVSDSVALMQQMQDKLSSADRAFAWGRIAYHAARTHNTKALDYYALAKNTMLDREQMAWKVRAALRAADWDAVAATIAMMQPEQQQEAAWRYWKARALHEKGMTAEANKILAPLSRERHYYGWLAAEDLESVVGNVSQDYEPTEMEVMSIASQPAIKRSLELQKLGMRWEAKAEWVWATRDFDDRQLLAAAEYAMNQDWYDIAIATADNTRQLHNFSLRYPTPYRDLFRAAAQNEGIDEAWIYGLARQESRFMHHAKSGVGAAGLMQIMPATAKWAAKRIGMSNYGTHLIHDLPTNVSIGTYYLRYTFEMMNGQAVMATAAYNAGPSRAKRWLASEPLEAAIYIESIPFTETRGYVQKVMANALMYAPRLGRSGLSLKSRLGVIPGTNKPEVTVAADEE